MTGVNIIYRKRVSDVMFLLMVKVRLLEVVSTLEDQGKATCAVTWHSTRNCLQYSQGTHGTTPPILVSMSHGAGKAAKQSGSIHYTRGGKINLQKNQKEKFSFPG